MRRAAMLHSAGGATESQAAKLVKNLTMLGSILPRRKPSGVDAHTPWRTISSAAMAPKSSVT